jgi:hypothetical protein
VNIVAVYRVTADGALVRTDAYDGEVRSIDDLVDVDGDGRFELRVSAGFIPDDGLIDLDGTGLSGTTVPYFGCPC